MRRISSLAVGAAVLVFSTVACGALVSQWRGEGNATDSVGANHGVVGGIVNYTPGVVGQAFKFPDNGYINIPNPAAGGLVSPTGFTIAGWIRLDGADPPPEGGPGAIINYGSTLNTSGFIFAQGGLTGNASPIVFLINTSGQQQFTVLQSPFPYWSLGQVYHFAITFDAATHSMSLYRDGQLEATRSDVPGTNMATDQFASFQLGRAINNGATFDGMLDEVSFYNTALSAAEVAALVPEPTVSGTLALATLLVLSRRFR